ncbi:amidase signature enzyme [Periconia macrospinosa]|uniref:Amidase signature enzyme n=1 Tax=Periconia macrospinosa TaxID=97972 RepID=A0A2V1DZ46_9PLEO|nr:amidase signature enzyme [Periconia macrospinosa]
MSFIKTISRSLLLSHAARAALIPEHQSLLWKYEGKNFWASLSLDAQTFALESPAGAAPNALSKRDAGLEDGKYHACTVLTLDSGVSAAELDTKLEEYQAVEDDVWSMQQFGQCLIVKSSGDTLAPIDLSSLANYTAAVYTVPNASGLSNGPYVTSMGSSLTDINFAPAYGIHEDVWDSFISGSVPTDVATGSHLAMQVSIPGTRTPAIIVPSRIKSVASTEDVGPLAGLRFAVKDIFHVKGLKTSGGSRAYYQVYGPQNYTTQTVEKSLAGGAQLVGKTRTIAFALGAPNNGAEIDYLDPWNPRGDGYQSTGGSSSGSGSAATAYEWLDFTIGSDTGGSVRFPARFGGLYGYKPTHGIFNLTGILVAIAEQDTPGFMTRSPSIFTKLGMWWAKDTPLENAAETPLPSQLLYYADEAPLAQPEAEAMKLAFFSKVEAALNFSTSSINMTETWIDKGPAPNQTITDYMTYVYSDQNSIQFYEKIGRELDELYGAYNNGSHFPADPMVNETWFDALNPITQSRYPESVNRRKAFASWFNSHILPSSNTTCSESIFAHSLHIAPGNEKVTYSAPHVASYYWNGVFVNYAGIPEIVVPIGQIKYDSLYTLRPEWQPVTVAFAAAKGCDLQLFRLVAKLEQLGLLKETLPGKVAYHTDEIW